MVVSLSGSRPEERNVPTNQALVSQLKNLLRSVHSFPLPLITDCYIILELLHDRRDKGPADDCYFLLIVTPALSHANPHAHA